MERGKFYVVLGIAFLFLMPLVFAQSYGFGYNVESQIEQVLNQFVEILRPIFEFLLGDYSGSEFLLVKSLLLIIVFIIVNVVLKKSELGKTMGAGASVVAIIVAILAIRFMPEEDIFKIVLLPYSVLGIALTTILPFLIFFYFVHATKMGGVGRRLSWAVFGFIFVGLYFTRKDLDSISNYIYLAVISGVALAFFLDRGIQRYFSAHELNVFLNKQKGKAASSLQSEYMNLLNVDTPEAKRRRGEIENNLRRIGAGVP
ncbi:MAG: hypothetical protein U9Q06_01435 [Nanoarchaeota archaeon]|nr:hypothetical protein [Nanoarchaeota archaeon]